MVNYSKDNWVVNQIMPPLGVDTNIKKCEEIAVLLKLKKCLSSENISGTVPAQLNLSSLPNTPLKPRILPNDHFIDKHSAKVKKKSTKNSKIKSNDIKEFQTKVNNNESMLGYLVEKSVKKSIHSLKNKDPIFLNDSTQNFINHETPILRNENSKCIKFYEPLENISNNFPPQSKTNKCKTKKGKNCKEKQPGNKIDSFLVPQSGDNLKILQTFKLSQNFIKPNSPKQLTDYFPVIKRSSRRCKIDIDKEYQNHLEILILNNCEDGLKVVHFADKGRGVVATRKFDKNSFVVEYAGDLITPSQAKLREIKYKVDSSIGCYMYYFELGGKQYCVDATAETGRLGRLVNHSRKLFNCKTKALFVKNWDEKNVKEPKLILVTTRDIEPGEEFLYDYGERDKEIIKANPWLLS